MTRFDTVRWPVILWGATVILGIGACGSRSLGLGSDGSVPPDGSLSGDGEVPDPCLAMDARTDPGLWCDDPAPVGWSWDGFDCVPVFCGCQGRDCGALYATASACYSARAPACLPDPECMDLDMAACEAAPGCGVVWYGGGCIDLDTCEEGAPPDGNRLCWEQGFVCLPAGPPCADRGPGSCDGDCFWWERRQRGCFSQGEGNCCVEEGYGYCAPVPGTEPPDRCAPQQVGSCPEACANLVGYYWDGAACAPILCCCEGPDCGETYDTAEACGAAHAACTDNACVAAGGTCAEGDFVLPTCSNGYGQFGLVERETPGVCGLGVCCTPCPAPGAGVSYTSRSPAECPTAIDWDCMDPEVIPFNNECGCGCLAL